MLVSAIFLLFSLTIHSLLIPESQFIHDNVHRNFDLSSQLVREKRAIAIVAGEQKQVQKGQEYYLLVQKVKDVPSNWTVSYIQAKEKDAQNDLPVTYKGEIEKEGHQFLAYSVKLQSGGERVILVVDIVYAHALDPFPKAISQNQKQMVLFRENLFMPSPYATKKQKLKINLASATIESFTKHPNGSKSGKQLTYSLESNEKPYAYEPLLVHSENNAPFITVTRQIRELWLSSVGGNLAVEEYFYIRHDGAQLDGQFSRMAFMQSQHFSTPSSMVKELRLDLPPRVSDPYFKDDVGNVSTSHFRREPKQSVLELKPRYPLFGGWIYTWFHGYNLPLQDYLKFYPEKSVYVFQSDFIKGLKDAPVNDFTLKVVLPEGAQDVQIHLPFEIKQQEKKKTFTYVDTLGRTTLLLHHYNLVDEHEQKFQVSFKLSSFDHFRKAFVLSAGFLFVFLLSILYWRIDFQISTQTQQQQQQKNKSE